MSVFALGMVLGCGGGGRPATPSGKVSGTVSLAGKPLTEGVVNFSSAKSGFGATGVVNKDGTYALEGPIPVGPYNVFITFNIAPSKIGTPAEAVMKSVPKKYLNQKTSELTAEVKEGANEHKFDLK